MARGAASCGPAVSGNSTLTNPVINDQAITVTGNPNQTVSLSNDTAVINEQTSTILGTSAAVNVYALHVTTVDTITGAPVAEAVLAAAQPQIDCQAGPPPDASFGTGGGWIPGEAGGHANFGVVGGVQPDGSLKAHVVYDDHSTSFTFKSTTISNVDNNSSPCQTTITGTGEANGVPGVPFTVVLTDNGEPGAGNDTFQIIASPENNFGTLSGGNIQKHNQTCP